MKPCYLFALVAGDLAHKEDTFKTKSGRDVALRIFVQVRHAQHFQSGLCTEVRDGHVSLRQPASPLRAACCVHGILYSGLQPLQWLLPAPL